MATSAVTTEEENLIILDDVITEETPDIKIEDSMVSDEIIDFWSDSSNNLQIDLWNNDSTKEEITSSTPDLGEWLSLDNTSSTPDLGEW